MKRLCILFFATCILIYGAGCKPESEAAKEAEHKREAAPKEQARAGEVSLTPEAAKIAGIETATVQNRTMQDEIKAPGTVITTAQGRALITPPVSGKVVRLFAGPGDSVQQGQALAVIESPELAHAATAIAEAERGSLSAEADIHRAESEMDLSRAKLRTAKEQLARQSALAKAGAFSQPSLQAAQKDGSDAEGDLQSAKEDEATHTLQLERAERLFKQELISRTELEQAKLAVAQDGVHRERAQRRLQVTQAALKREQQVAQKGLLTAREVQTAEAEVRAAALEVRRSSIVVDGAKAALSGAQRGVQNARSNFAAVRGSGNSAVGATLTLSAPIGGIVTGRVATLGQAVERSSELFEIENLVTVWVTANVAESDIAAVRRGLAVRVAVAAFPTQTFRGVVQVVSSVLDAKTRAMPVQCLVQNPGGRLRNGMFATVWLGTRQASSALAVPVGALSWHDEQASVFVSEDGKYVRRPVQAGRSSGGFTEVKSGVKQGEKVVTKGLFVLESETRKSELKGEKD